jgi:hypothetical protein
MWKTNRVNIVIGLVMALTMVLALAFNLAAADAVKVSVTCPAEVAPGSPFTVRIDLGAVANLKEWQFDLTYKADVIKIAGNEGASGVSPGKIGSIDLPVTSWSFNPRGTPGVLTVNGRLPSNPVSGQGYLAEIKFNSIGALNAKSDISLANVFLSDNSGNAISSTLTKGTVTISANPKTGTPGSSTPSPTTSSPTPSQSTKPASSPTSTGTATPKPSSSATAAATAATTAATTAAATSTPASPSASPAVSSTKITIAAPPTVPLDEAFVIRIDISKAVKLDSFHFILDYDPEVLEVKSVSEGLIGQTKGDIKEWALTPPGTEGKVEVRGVMSGAKGISGSGYLAKIHCHMIGDPGVSSELSFSEIDLLSSTGDSLEIESVINGSVAVESSKATIRAPAEVPPDGTFEAVIGISQVSNLASYNIVISYSPTVIEVLDVSPGMVGPDEVPVDDWDYIPTGEQGKLYLKGTYEDDEGISGSGSLGKLKCQAVGRLNQRSKITLETVELFDKEGNSLLQTKADKPPSTTVIIATPSFFSSKINLIGVIAGGVIIVGVVVFLVLRRLRRRRVKRVQRPVMPGRTPPGGDQSTDLAELMRNRVSQLPSRRDRRPNNKDR